MHDMSISENEVSVKQRMIHKNTERCDQNMSVVFGWISNNYQTPIPLCSGNLGGAKKSPLS